MKNNEITPEALTLELGFKENEIPEDIRARQGRQFVLQLNEIRFVMVVLNNRITVVVGKSDNYCSFYGVKNINDLKTLIKLMSTEPFR